MRAKMLVAVAAVALVQGCGSAPSATPPPLVADQGESVQLASAEPGAPAAKGRAQLWTENCPRCHNARPATYYTLQQWEVAMHHMRVRCPLTADEHRKIMEFFKAAK